MATQRYSTWWQVWGRGNSLRQSYNDELTEHQKHFKRVTNACTYSHKDLAGALLLALGAFFLLAIATSHFVVAIGCLALAGAMVASNPIKILYAASCLLTAYVRTPEFLPLSIFFPNHVQFLEPAIKQEIKDYLSVHRPSPMHALFNGENSYVGTGGVDAAQWRFKLLKMAEEYSNVLSQSMPALAAALLKCPEVIACGLSVLEPGVRIPMHVGYYKGLVRYMLPIVVPKEDGKLWLNVNGIQKHWKEGIDFLWDDMYPHAAYNTTNETRVVLFMDIRRAQLPAVLQILNSAMIKLVNISGIASAEIRKNEAVQSIATNVST